MAHSLHNRSLWRPQRWSEGHPVRSKGNGQVAMKIYENPRIAEAAKKEFEQTMVGQDYVCPMERTGF